MHNTKANHYSVIGRAHSASNAAERMDDTNTNGEQGGEGYLKLVIQLCIGLSTLFRNMQYT